MELRDVLGCGRCVLGFFRPVAVLRCAIAAAVSYWLALLRVLCVGSRINEFAGLRFSILFWIYLCRMIRFVDSLHWSWFGAVASNHTLTWGWENKHPHFSWHGNIIVIITVGLYSSPPFKVFYPGALPAQRRSNSICVRDSEVTRNLINMCWTYSLLTAWEIVFPTPVNPYPSLIG